MISCNGSPDNTQRLRDDLQRHVLDSSVLNNNRIKIQKSPKILPIIKDIKPQQLLRKRNTGE